MTIEPWTPPLLRVEARTVGDESTAAHLAAQLAGSGQLTIIPGIGCTDDTAGERGEDAARAADIWCLSVSGEQRTLVRPDGAHTTVDFTAGRTGQRARQASPGREPLLRALGITTLTKRLGRPVTILDTTAGFGVDAWLAASAGCQLLLLERSVLMHVLLDGALAQARATPASEAVARRIDLLEADAVHWLCKAPHPAADVIYLDPMFPPRQKSAHVRIGMQFLHALLAPDPAERATHAALLAEALPKAAARVVVKRPRGAPELPRPPTWSGQITTIDTPRMRYDVHHVG